MGFKLYATGITNPHLTHQACEFRDRPSVDNWLKLERAMKAHQAAFLYPEGVIQNAIENVERHQVVGVLASLHDDVTEHTKVALSKNHIKLVKPEDAFQMQ